MNGFMHITLIILPLAYFELELYLNIHVCVYVVKFFGVILKILIFLKMCSFGKKWFLWKQK